MRKLFILIFMFSFHSARAEYRVFVLQITNSKTQASRTLYSTLDPLQYKSIYPLALDESINYVDTWRCKGHTGHFKILCAKPPQS